MNEKEHMNESIQRFQMASLEARLRMACSPENEQALRALFGNAGYEEYRAVAERLDEQHLSIRTPPNLVFVPGVMGSLLQSQTKGGIWWVDARTRHHIDDLRLAPGGAEDADPNNRITPCSTDPSYEPFLTAILQRDDFGHIVFPYDWRKSLLLSAAALKERVLQLHAVNGNRPVHLVAHSMGGLLVRTTLMEYGRELWPVLGRIVFIGTPHYGSPAIAGYLKNHLWGFDIMALLGRYLSRETFRSFRGVLGMLPAPFGVYPGTRPSDSVQWHSGDANASYDHPCSNFDLYQADSWKIDLKPEQTSNLQQVLTQASDLHRRLYEAHQALEQGHRDRILMIVGVGFQTLFRLEYEPDFFGFWERTHKVTRRIEGDPHRDGDSRVPLASAELENVETRYIRGVHGGLTNIPAVYNDVFQWLNEAPLELPDTEASALSGHLDFSSTSEAPHLDGTFRQNALISEDPGVWDVTEPSPSQIANLETMLEAGHLPEFITVRLL
jgi:pimeloyl-ACP methyl ester carboxylesterase